MTRYWRWLPLTLILIGIICFFYFHLYRYLSYSSLQEHHQQLQHWTQSHYLIVVLLYILIYIAIVALSVPGATIMTLASGFLFGLGWGTLYVVISATIGAVLIFLAVHTAFGNRLIAKASSRISQMQAGFKKNAFNYLLVLRFIPLFPFWLVNIVPAVLDVDLKTFTLATFIAILPGSFVYVSLGNGLGTLFAANETPNLKIIFQPSILLPLIGLAFLSIVPLIYKRIKGDKR